METTDENEYERVGGFVTRMFTANMDGSDLYVLDPSGYTSHFIWDDPEHVTAWTQPAGKPAGFYRFRDRSNEVVPVGRGIMVRNGHNTYLPGTDNEWILNDTYPQGDAREQVLYLFHEPSNRRVDLGRFHEPEAYQGEWRVDLHPRCNRAGTSVCFDSTHESKGRQMYIIEVGDLVR